MKNVIALLCLMILANMAYSQDDKKLRLGLVGASDFTWFSSDRPEVINDGVKLSFTGGISVEYQLLDNYYLLTGIQFNTLKGGLQYTGDSIPFIANETLIWFNSTQIGNDVTVGHTLNYVEVPIGMKLKTNEIGYFTYHASFGIRPMFNTSAVADADQLSLQDANINDEISFFNLGGFVGLGADYIITRKFIVSATLRYNPGFTDLTTNDAGRVKDKIVMNSVALQIGVSF